MNPFDLTGPDFLRLYVALSASVVIGFYIFRHVTDHAGRPTEILVDPYLIAYLRGGQAEALRTALVALIDQGAVKLDEMILTAVEGDPRRARVPLETELLAAMQRPRAMMGLIDDRVGAQACAEYRQRLERLGYLRRERSVGSYNHTRIAAGALLAVVAAVKIVIGMQRDRPVTLLFILAGLAILVVGSMGVPIVTGRGRNALQSVQGLLAGAWDRLATLGPGARADELVMIAAAFGLAAPPMEQFAFVNALGSGPAFAAAGSANSGWLGGGSTTCGGGGSSCGSSCGGGGCGGGCGGCGS